MVNITEIALLALPSVSSPSASPWFPYSFLASILPSSGQPIVELGYGFFQGMTKGNTTAFLGIPYAAPPIGELRFQPPQPPLAFQGVKPATNFGFGCINQAQPGTPIPSNSSEDCLFVNIISPSKIPSDTKLPVVFWIYGGAFEIGDSSDMYSDGYPVVYRSMDIGEPVVYVSINYRLGGFGFLASKEVKAAGWGNVGLRDQRFALQWVQEHISKFGGDPKKVIIWGESAGAISVALQMLMNKGDAEGLFSGAFMNSGSPMPLRDITAGQKYYDFLVSFSGCSATPNNSDDGLATSSNVDIDPIVSSKASSQYKSTLDCLQFVPVETLAEAINQTPNAFSYESTDLAWIPRVDGLIFTENPVVSVAKDHYADVPFVNGACHDEGTLFSFANMNITTDAGFQEYIAEHLLFGSNADEVAQVAKAYSEDPAEGSPFGTGLENAVTPQFKRLAAIKGDWIFQSPRRSFLKHASKRQPVWSFMYKRGKNQPLMGASHGCDISEFRANTTGYSDFIGTDSIINFANTLDPTKPRNPKSFLTTSGINWTTYSEDSPALLTFIEPVPAIEMTEDTEREEAMNLLAKLAFNVD